MDSCVMHGEGTEKTRNTPYFCRCGVVAFLHPVVGGNRSRAGFGLAEVVVAVTVLGAGVLGVAALGNGARKLGHIAAVRGAQTFAAATVLEGASAVGPEALEIMVDTTVVLPGLLEFRVTVSGSGPAGPQSWVARRPAEGP